MSKHEIDEYLGRLDDPRRATLTQLRDTIAAIVPKAEQCISYGLPAFKHHLSYLPHSGSVLRELAHQTEGYTKTKGSLHFPVDEPLPKHLVAQLLEVRMAQAFGPKP